MTPHRIAPILLVTAVLFAGNGCATRFDAAKARYMETPYVITDHFYEEAPQRVAVMPFATRSEKAIDYRKAEACRRIFYQHLCLRDFEDVDLRKFDRSVWHSTDGEKDGMLSQLVSLVRKLDVVGMTTVVDLDALFSDEKIKYADFIEMIRLTRDQMQADAYLIGMMRDYGRFYAVLISSVGISTRVEMRSASTSKLLWRGEKKKRNYEVPLTLNPLDVPRLLYDVWQNSRGLAVDSLAYQVYGDLCYTMPHVPDKIQVYVVARDGIKAPYYRKPGVLMWWSRGRLRGEERLEFVLEQNGWYKCTLENGKTAWIFRRHGKLVDEQGRDLDPFHDLAWFNEPAD